MSPKQNDFGDEMSEVELRTEIAHYLEEKEKIRKIIGQIGGETQPGTKMLNHLFLILVVSAFVIALLFQEWRVLTVEVAILLVSLKLVYLVSQEAKVNHFQFWMLSSIEWRLNDLGKKFYDLESKIGKASSQPPETPG